MTGQGTIGKAIQIDMAQLKGTRLKNHIFASVRKSDNVTKRSRFFKQILFWKA